MERCRKHVVRHLFLAQCSFFLMTADLLSSFPLLAAKRLVIIVQQAFPRSHIKSADVALLASQ